jgi:SAM-dependent methyltransferase
MPAPASALEAYERTARCYDAFTAHHDYDLWLANLLAEARRHGLRGNRLLDVACGTGKSFLPLLRDGWRVTGVDISPAMLAIAAAKAGAAARLERHDMRALPRLGGFDLVWCLDDAVNYLLDPDELERALRGLRRNLAPGGICLFDVNTLATYRSAFATRHELDAAGMRLTWRGLAPADVAPGSTVEAVLEIEPGDGAPERALHRQRHFRPEEIEAALAAAGLAPLATAGHGEDARLERPLDETRHNKAVYMARNARR